MSFTISTVKGKQDLNDFLQLPYRIYRNDPNQVYPLLDEMKHFFDKKKNPFHNHATSQLWLA